MICHSHFTDPGYTSFKIDSTSRRSHWLLVLLLGITFSSLIVSQIDRGIDPVDSDRNKQNLGTRVVHSLVCSRQCELLGNGGHSRNLGGGEGYSLGADLRSDPHRVRESCTGSRLKTSPSPNQDPKRADITETRAHNKKQNNTKTYADLQHDCKPESKKQDQRGHIKPRSFAEPGAGNKTTTRRQKGAKTEIRASYSSESHNQRVVAIAEPGACKEPKTRHQKTEICTCYRWESENLRSLRDTGGKEATRD